MSFINPRLIKLLLKRIIKLLSVILVIIVSLSTIAIVIVDYKFNRLNHDIFYSGCFKVWAHRGFFKEGLQQNSIESFLRAFELGAAGTELDIFYDLNTNEYVVSHDYPYHLINGQILKLEDVFKKVGKCGYFWLDFKNLAILSKQDTQKAVFTLHNLLKKYNLTDKIIVESTNPINLKIVSKLNIYTSYWIMPEIYSYDNFFYFQFDIFRYKLFYLYGNFSALSMDYNLFNKKLEGIFANIPIHLFTINDSKKLMNYFVKKNVKIILSDEKKNYSENNCIK